MDMTGNSLKASICMVTERFNHRSLIPIKARQHFHKAIFNIVCSDLFFSKTILGQNQNWQITHTIKTNSCTNLFDDWGLCQSDCGSGSKIMALTPHSQDVSSVWRSYTQRLLFLPKRSCYMRGPGFFFLCPLSFDLTAKLCKFKESDSSLVPVICVFQTSVSVWWK